MLYAIAAVIVVILDQAVKFWIAGTIPFETGIIRLVPGFLSLVNIHNTGAAFSFLADGGARIWFIGISAGFCLLVIIALATNLISKPLGRWAAVFVAAGGLGNCIDRILYGYVQDMFKLEFINFPVFNVADIFITVFCIVFILYVIFGTRDKGEDDYDYDVDEEEEEEPAPKRRSRRERKEEPAPAPVEQPSRERRAETPRTEASAVRQAPVRAAAPVEPRNVRPTGSAAGEPTIVASRKARQSKYEQEYEQYKAAKAQRQAAAAATEQQPVMRPTAQSSSDNDNPFAEWDRANVRRQANVRQEALSFDTAPKAAAPKPAVAPKPAAAAKPASVKPAVETDEFDLESILNEF